MPAGRPIFKYRSNAFRVLSAMADGRYYARSVLRQLTGLKRNSLSPALISNYQKGRVRRFANPVFRHSCPNDQYRLTGLGSCPWVWRITDAGIEALEREKEVREKFRFKGFESMQS